MPAGKDHCRTCGKDIWTLSVGGAPASGVICGGCKKAVCLDCQPKPCPHPDLPRNEGPVSEAEHAALRAELSDEAALEKRLAELRAQRGAKAVGL